MTEETERRKREGEEVGEVTDEESAEQWLVKKKGEKYTEWQQRGNSSRNAAFISRRWQDVCVWVCVCGRGVLNL